MTRTGEHRAWYAANVEPSPSRFANGGADYKAWARRADKCVRFACCTSNIGPRCGHLLGGAGVTLKRLTAESLALPLVDGVREGDPLTARVNGATWRDCIDDAELVIGRTIERVRGDEQMVARVRSELRRFVAKGGRA